MAVEAHSVEALALLVARFHCQLGYRGLKFLVRKWQEVPLEFGGAQVRYGLSGGAGVLGNVAVVVAVLLLLLLLLTGLGLVMAAVKGRGKAYKCGGMRVGEVVPLAAAPIATWILDTMQQNVNAYQYMAHHGTQGLLLDYIRRDVAPLAAVASVLLALRSELRLRATVDRTGSEYELKLALTQFGRLQVA